MKDCRWPPLSSKVGRSVTHVSDRTTFQFCLVSLYLKQLERGTHQQHTVRLGSCPRAAPDYMGLQDDLDDPCPLLPRCSTGHKDVAEGTVYSRASTFWVRRSCCFLTTKPDIQALAVSDLQETQTNDFSPKLSAHQDYVYCTWELDFRAKRIFKSENNCLSISRYAIL